MNRHINEKFGRLTIRMVSMHRADGDVNKKPQSWAIAECDCGSWVHTTKCNILSGHTKSCGCIEKENPNGIKHTHAGRDNKSRTYISWYHMKSRCDNPKDIGYKNYGGRGITYCEEFRTFESFLKAMGERPEGTSIDRINNELGYFPENCKWSTPNEQRHNRRDTKGWHTTG